MLIIISLFLISFVCAESQSSIGTFKQGEIITITQGCVNSTYANITKIYVDGTQNNFINSETSMIETSNNNYDYNFSQTQTIGTYVVIGHCDLDGIDTQWSPTFEVTPSGWISSTGQSMILVFIVLMIFVLLYFSVNGIVNAVNGGWQITYICITYILFFSLFFVCWLLSKNYLYSIPILESIFWIIWLTLSILFWPFIIIVSAYILKKEGEALMTDKYVSQGYSKEDALEMSKKHRRR